MLRVKINFAAFAAALCALALSFSLSSCSDPNVIGLDLQPASEQLGLNRVDSFTIRAFTVPEDSLVIWSTAKNAIEAPTLYLGRITDPNVGVSTAGFVSQIRLGNTITGFDGVTTPDSIILSLSYRASFGDSTIGHNIRAYKMTEDLYTDSTYYTGHVYPQSDLIGSVDNFHADFTDSITIDTVKLAPQFRMALDTAFGGQLLRDYILNPANFQSNATFLSYLKGIKVTEDGVSPANSMLTFFSNSSINKVTLYYGGSKSYQFLIDGNAVRMSYFNHVYIPQNIDNIADNQLVVQSMAGLKDSIVIPDLNKIYKDGPVSVNSAQLIIKLVPGSGSAPLINHSNLIILASDSLGKNILTNDASETTSGYFGGVYDAVNDQYKFNIARQVQRTLTNLVKGEKDYGLFLVAGGSTSNAQRTLLQGANIQLIVTYTKVNP